MSVHRGSRLSTQSPGVFVIRIMCSVSKQHRLVSRFIGLTSALVVLVYASAIPAFAREIGIAFVDDGLGESSPRLSELIVEELQPLLDRGDTLAPVYLGAEGAVPVVMNSLARAFTDPDIDYVIATGLIGSQAIYQEADFSKPTYLLRVLDPSLTGAPLRDDVQNLRSYITINALDEVFERLGELFQAKHVGIILPEAALAAQGSIGGAVTAAAENAGIDVQFIALDFEADVASQLPDFDAAILPTVTASERERTALLRALQLRKIPSFAVGSDDMVLSGALISDTLDEDRRVLARRVALDLQSAIAGEIRTRGVRSLEPRKSTTINIGTARALDIDFPLDELMTARLVQGASNASTLGFLSTLELAADRNLGLRGQGQQVRIDKELVEQARAKRRPQLAAKLDYTRRGEALPEQDIFAALSLSQTIYSPSANADVDVAGLGFDASQKALEQTRLDTVQQTASAYFQALQAQARFETTLRDLTLNRENLGLAEQRKRSGSGSGADIYRWQARIAASETEVLRAYTENTSAQSVLAQLLNTRLQIPSTLSDVDLDQPPFDLLHEGIEPYLNSTGRAELVRKASAARALKNSPQLESVAANVAINDTLEKALKRSYYTPELSVTAAYGRYLDSTVNSAGIELDNEDDWSVTVTAELPLWLGGKRSSLIRQYQAQGELAETQLQNARIALWADSGNAVNALVSNYRSIELSARAEEAALKSQQITQNAYRLGAASVTELLDAQNSYLDAQNNAQIARYQYLTALVDFQVLMGDLPMLLPGAEQQQWLQNFKQSMLSEAVR